MTPKTYSVKQAASELDISVPSTYNWIKAGRLKASENAKGQTVIAAPDLRACKAAEKAKTTVKPAAKQPATKKGTDKSMRIELLEIADALYELANKLPRGKR